MFRRITVRCVPAAAAVLFAFSAPGVARAQGRGAPFPMPGMGGRRGGPMQRPQGALTLDPAHTTEADLLQRIDVRHELMLDGRQREKLLAMIQKTQDEMYTKQRESMMEMRKQQQQSGQNPRDMSPEERRAFRQEMAQKVSDSLNPVRDQRDKTLESILTSWQIQRLHQIDLQWRTAMALVDPKVSEMAGLSEEQQPKINDVVQEFRAAQGQAMRSVFQTMRGARNNTAAPGNPPGSTNPNGAAGVTPNSANGSTRNGAPPPATRPGPDMEAMRNGFVIAEKQAEKLRLADNVRVLALLTPQQKQKWQSLIGKPFYFQPGNQTAQE